jgi:hypothetical protein
MIKHQEESFSKMQSEIAQLQNKIRGLESKLAPSNANKVNITTNGQNGDARYNHDGSYQEGG